MDTNKIENNAGNCDYLTRKYFDSFVIETRQIDSVLPNMEINLFGTTLSTPIMSSAMSSFANMRPDGAIQLAEGMKAANSVMWAGGGTIEELESITKTGVKTVKIIKPYDSNDLVIKEIEAAKRFGALAVGMDIDQIFHKTTGKHDVWREYDMYPKTVGDLKEYVKAAEIPFVVKGVLSEQDACKCAEAGVKAIVVSNHHGKMDYTIPPVMALPRIVKAVGKDMTIIVDSGILNGYDVFKALALGADAVCVARTLMRPNMEEGAEGVTKKITEMTQELASIMAKTGSVDVKHIDASVLFKFA